MSLSVALKTEPIEPGQLREELVSRIADTLNEMPEVMRRAFILNHYQGQSLTQITDHIGLSEANVDALLRTADHRLHMVLTPLRLEKRPSA